ncbi:ATP-dependent endonuclease [Agromyces sp. NPDC056523]|uniref:ATP-dependent nuclease n=1 Tax=Agromyces sp. NPDC056523 TaxID=3345850 RepID=UPI00366C3368
MKLTHVRIKDFRSFTGEHDFEVSSGVNYFVGPNNYGKSNLIRSLELALDPDSQYVPDRDRPAKLSPAGGAPRKTRITLRFSVGSSGPEKTLLARAEAYEQKLRGGRAARSGTNATFAADGEVHFVTEFGSSGARVTSFQAKAEGARSLKEDSAEHIDLLKQFRSVVRFAVVHSGEDLESLLKGKFTEILQLVISDHLNDEMSKAEKAREDYLSALQAQLLEPLRHKIEGRVHGMFPEISVANLVPSVPTVSETLSSVDVRLGDTVTLTGLADKGTGVRGAVLVSMLQYLAEQSRRSLVLAVEEPEAFLHPAAQEATRGHLEDLASRADVSLIVTTHSPYVISHEQSALVTELRKNSEGITEKAASLSGNESRAELLGSLYRDAGLAHLLERALEIPSDAAAVVVTEGYTDGLFLQACCKASGRDELLEGLHFVPAHGASKVVPQAILAAAGTTLPVIAVLDHDDNGRAAADKLKSFNWEPTKRILSLSKWPGKCSRGHDVEIEDLLPPGVVNAIVSEVGEDAAVDAKVRCGAGWHLSLSNRWKDAAIERLEALLIAEADPAAGMIWLAEEIQRRAGMSANTPERGTASA